jgi:hypothetical protein
VTSFKKMSERIEKSDGVIGSCEEERNNLLHQVSIHKTFFSLSQIS